MITAPNDALFLLRNKFIQKLMLDGRKATATIVFEESLEILKSMISKEIFSNKNRSKSKKALSFLETLETKSKLEIFEIALNRAKP
jgi:ribosomal protein S7